MHMNRQPMPPAGARVTILEAENEALRRKVAELEAVLAGLRETGTREAVFQQRAVQPDVRRDG